MKENLNELFSNFLDASTCKATLGAFSLLVDAANIEHPPQKNEAYDHCEFYPRLKNKLKASWKAQSLFAKLDKKYYDQINFAEGKKNQRNGSRVAKDASVLIVGAGPCGLRMAILTALLGAKTVVIEKRDSFSRNNVLHLWPFTIEDLKSLGAKKFNGRFCSGSIDHVSIRQLQLILLKSALLFGVEIHVNTMFIDLIEPMSQNKIAKWKAEVEPSSSLISDFEFDAIIGADGRKNSLKGFERKSFRASLALGITVNFINKHTAAEAKVPEISGINFIYRQDFFRDLNKMHGIDLENIVYYRDDTHYFVMTARKRSLVQRGVFKHAHDDPAKLVSYKNIDQASLLKYGLDAVNFSTHNKLPDLEVAINTYGLPDIALFDFTCMKSSVNACMFREVKGVKLFLGLIGDGLLEPFWPKGTGIAKGFLAAFDTAWAFKEWVSKRDLEKQTDASLEISILTEREAMYRILAQTEMKALLPDYSAYNINPKTRYQFVPAKLRTKQVEEFYVSDRPITTKVKKINEAESRDIVPSTLTRNVSFVRSNKLLNWCQNILRNCNVDIPLLDMDSSWKNGLALCFIINYYRPDLINADKLDSENVEYNNQLAFDVAEKHLGITPVMSGKEMAECETVDNLLMVSYISQFYEILKTEKPMVDVSAPNSVNEDDLKISHKKKSPVGLLYRLSHHIKRKSGQRGSAKEYNVENDAKRKKTLPKQKSEVAQQDSEDVVLTKAVISTVGNGDKENAVVLRKRDDAAPGIRKSATNRISALGQQLISQWEQNAPQPAQAKIQTTNSTQTSSNVCYFCGKKVYIVERLSVEGLFFHRQCFKCSHCDTPLRPLNYKRDSDTGKFYCNIHFYANAKYLKTGLSAASSETNIAENGDPPVSEVASADQFIPSEPTEELSSPSESLVATIENGQVVMKRDMTPKRHDMEAMHFSLLNDSVEVPEDELYKHNLRCSRTEESLSDISSDSDEDWNAIANESLGLNDQTPLEFLSEYHSKSFEDKGEEPKANATASTVETLLSSASEGDDDVSSLSSGSSDPQPSDNEEPDTGMKYDGDSVSISSISDGSAEMIDDSISISSASSDSEKGLAAVETDQMSCEELELKNAPSPKDTTSREISSPGSGSDKPMETSSNDDQQQKGSLDNMEEYIPESVVAHENFSLSSASSSEDSLSNHASKQGVDGDTISLNSLSTPSSPSKTPELSSVSHEDFTSCVDAENDTSIWESKSTDQADSIKVSLSNESCIKKFSGCLPDVNTLNLPPVTTQEEDANLSFLQKDVDSPLASYSVAAICEELNEMPKFHPTPAVRTRKDISNRTLSGSSSEVECFYTPSAPSPKKPAFESFCTADPDTTENSSFLDDTIGSSGHAEETVESDSHETQISDTDVVSSNPPRSPRKLPEVPTITRRRRLPMIPKIKHLEALSPTGKESSSAQQRRIDLQLKRHEQHVQARIRKMKLSSPNNNTEVVADEPSPDVKSGSLGRGFMDELPAVLHRRNAAMRKKHPRDSQDPNKTGQKKPSTLFSLSSKKKHAKAQKELPALPQPKTSPKVLSPSHRGQRRHNLSAYYTPEQIENKISQRVRIAAQRQAKEAERKRMARALVIQGQLEEVDSKQKLLEEKGVKLEKSLRSGEQGDRKENSLLMHEWFKLVQEKNALLRYENELMIYQRELQLEDRQSRLQQDLRERMAVEDSKKSSQALAKEKAILNEMLDVVEQRDQLVALLDEHRVQDKEENADIESLLIDKFSRSSSINLTPYQTLM